MIRLFTARTAIIALLLGAALASPASAKDKAKFTGIYELRTYTTAEGKLPALHKRFRDHTVALFHKHGMTNVIYWTPTNKPNTLIYLLAHTSRKARDKSFAAFRKDPAWLKALAASRKDGPIVKKVDSRFLKVTK